MHRDIIINALARLRQNHQGMAYEVKNRIRFVV